MTGDARAARSRGLARGRSRLRRPARPPRTETLVLPRRAGRSRRSRRTARSSPGSRRTQGAATPCTSARSRNGLQADAAEAGATRTTSPAGGPSARSPVTLAIAGKTSNVLWTLHESSPLQFDYLVGAGASATGASAASRSSRTRTAAPASGSAASPATERRSSYAVTSVDYEDEAGCLAGTGTCAMKIAGGGVYRVVGRQRPKLVPGTTRGAVAVAASRRQDRVRRDRRRSRSAGKPVAGADLPIEVVDAADGRVDLERHAAGHADRDRALGARARDARAHAARAAARLVRAARPAPPIGSVPVAVGDEPRR